MATFSARTQIFGPSAKATVQSSAVGTAALQAEVLALFDELRGRLLLYSMSFGLSLHDGEDVLQEVFMALFLHLQMERSRENLPAWTYRTTHNLSLRRRAALHMELSRAEPCPDNDPEAMDPMTACRDHAPGPEAQLLFRERQQRLRAVLRALPENDQLCLQLRAEGHRYREIASIVGISLGSVAASLARSFERLHRTDTR